MPSRPHTGSSPWPDGSVSSCERRTKTMAVKLIPYTIILRKTLKDLVAVGVGGWGSVVAEAGHVGCV